MKSLRMQKKLRKFDSALRQSGFALNEAEKRNTRFQLISTYKELFTRPPMAIFTMAGMQAHCVEAFRAEWPRSRLVSIDRQTSSARFTKAHSHERLTSVSTLENDLFLASLQDYSLKKSLSMWRFFRNQDREMKSIGHRAFEFDFPKFDLMFLDMTARYDSPDGRAARRMIDEHTLPHAVVGVTVSIGGRKEAAKSAAELAAEFCMLLKRSARAAYTYNYVTGAQMAFWILEIT